MSKVRPFDTHATAQRLRESISTIEWAVSVLPERWSHDLPDFYTQGEWGVAMNLAHLVVYEEEISLPVLAALAAGGEGVGATRSATEDSFLADAITIASEPIDGLLERLRLARDRQIDIVEAYDGERFNTAVTPLWSSPLSRASGRQGTPQSAGWVARRSSTLRSTATPSCAWCSSRLTDLATSGVVGL